MTKIIGGNGVTGGTGVTGGLGSGFAGTSAGSLNRDSEGEVIVTVLCLDCGEDVVLHSRGLCMTCYQGNRRNETLDEYPTGYFLNSPEQYVYWAAKFHPELVKAYLAELNL